MSSNRLMRESMYLKAEVLQKLSAEIFYLFIIFN